MRTPQWSLYSLESRAEHRIEKGGEWVQKGSGIIQHTDLTAQLHYLQSFALTHLLLGKIFILYEGPQSIPYCLIASVWQPLPCYRMQIAYAPIISSQYSHLQVLVQVFPSRGDALFLLTSPKKQLSRFSNIPFYSFYKILTCLVIGSQCCMKRSILGLLHCFITTY